MNTGKETPEELVALLTRAGARTSGDYETTVRASLIDRAAEYIKSTITTPEQLTVQDGSALARSMFEMAPETRDIRTHVLHMRDYFLTLVHAYNAVGAYQSAADAQKMAIAVHAYANEHVLQGLAWPPEAIDDGEGEKGLRTVGGGIMYGSEL